MDNNTYNQIQADLGGVADEFQHNIRGIMLKSDADEETKELVNAVCAKVYDSLNQLAILISKTARLTTK